VIPPEKAARFGGGDAWASLRPEALRLIDSGGAMAGTVRTTRYLGSGTRVAIDIGGFEVSAVAPAGQPVPEAGARVGLTWDTAALHRMEAG
jgi:putative spermidine/putrescine transport system ATP-binding protein